MGSGVSKSISGSIALCEFQSGVDAHESAIKQLQDGVTHLQHSVGAENLRRKGFTLEQLLQFYDFYQSKGKIISGTTTEQVVRDIVIPETAATCSCYMESDFMRSRGGGHMATKLVSHAWSSEFANTVMNIVVDASSEILSSSDFLEPVKFFNYDTIYSTGIIQASTLLKKLPRSVLTSIYWLCIFAVDEHHAICGDCWTCNRCNEWLADPERHLRAHSCLICKTPKRNPCYCGSIKHLPGSPEYEIDLFDEVVQKMDALVVSLDAKLLSIRRVWVVAEIGKAIQHNTVLFRLIDGLDDSSIEKLRAHTDLMTSVEACDATSEQDKQRILEDIRQMDGGLVAYDQFINCLLELNFGMEWRVSILPEAAQKTIANLTQIEMDLRWRRHDSFSLPNYFTGLMNLRNFAITCTSCVGLTSIAEFGKGLGQCQALQSATFGFNWCSGLTSIDEFGKGLGQCQALQSATFGFNRCKGLTSIDEFGKGLGQCQALQSATFEFGVCEGLTSIDEFGKGLGQCQALQSATFGFDECEGLTSIDEFGKGLGQCQALQSATFGFIWCSGLTSIDEFRNSLRKEWQLYCR